MQLAKTPSIGRLMMMCSVVLAAWAVGVAQAADFVGIVYPLHDVTLSVHTGGVVEKVHVALGERVKAGQPLLQQHTQIQEIEQQRRRVILADEAERQALEQRKTILEGMVRNATILYEQAGTVSRDELLKLRLELETTVGRLEQLRGSKKREQTEVDMADKEYALRVLSAPMAGVVTMIKVHPGEWAAPGDALLRLVDETVCELRVNVSAAAASRLSLGLRVSVLPDDPTLSAAQTGRVSFISPVMDAASSLVEVRVQMSNANRRIRPGIKARLRVEGVS